eukprot:SAG11_NODE_1883_length_4124_cov_7.056149_5_plen_137_part_00
MRCATGGAVRLPPPLPQARGADAPPARGSAACKKRLCVAQKTARRDAEPRRAALDSAQLVRRGEAHRAAVARVGAGAETCGLSVVIGVSGWLSGRDERFAEHWGWARPHSLRLRAIYHRGITYGRISMLFTLHGPM